MILGLVIPVWFVMTVVTARLWLRWYMSALTCVGHNPYEGEIKHTPTCHKSRGEIETRDPVLSWYAFLAGLPWPITLACLVISKAKPTEGELKVRARVQQARIDELEEANQRMTERLIPRPVPRLPNPGIPEDARRPAPSEVDREWMYDQPVLPSVKPHPTGG